MIQGTSLKRIRIEFHSIEGVFHETMIRDFNNITGLQEINIGLK
jgi:hypothetical protein